MSLCVWLTEPDHVSLLNSKGNLGLYNDYIVASDYIMAFGNT